MTRSLVVEGERGDRLEGVGGVELEADFGEAAGEVDPFEWGSYGVELLLRRRAEVRGMQRIREEGVLNISGDELLMLLLVLEAEGDTAGGFVFEWVLHQGCHCSVDVSAIGEDRVEWRTRERGSEFFLRHLAERVVVAVEEPMKVRMIRLVTSGELAENEGLEEPAGVGEMPLHRTGLR